MLFHFGLDLLPLGAGLASLGILVRGGSLSSSQWWSVGALAGAWIAIVIIRRVRRL